MFRGGFVFVTLFAIFWAEGCDLAGLEKVDRDAAANSDSNANAGDAGAASAEAWSKVAPSCAARLDCNGTSCCESLLVKGGAFSMGRSDDGNDRLIPDPTGDDEKPEHPATVADFYLDTFEVTVGRFRKFVDDYQRPKQGDGAHPLIRDSGWQSIWDVRLPNTGAELTTKFASKAPAATSEFTWTTAVGDNENKPINQISWYELFAFCVWDGGRLPTEAEWEYAAAGGSENRLYPWGQEKPSKTLATFQSKDYGQIGLPPVGGMPTGKGRWQQQDMAGSVWEWTLDATDRYSTDACTNCATLDFSNGGIMRRYRGGYYASQGTFDLRATRRYGDLPSGRYREVGGRCARNR